MGSGVKTKAAVNPIAGEWGEDVSAPPILKEGKGREGGLHLPQDSSSNALKV